jgi:predicted RecB family nuclease
VEEFIADPCWIDLYAVVDEWFLCAQGKGLKRIAPAAGFSWHDPEAGGENSMRWYRAAVGIDGEQPDPGQRERLLTYNSDDVAATHALRNWMTSPALEEVPLAAEL